MAKRAAKAVKQAEPVAVAEKVPPTVDEITAEVFKLEELWAQATGTEPNTGVPYRLVIRAAADALAGDFSHDDIYGRWPENRVGPEDKLLYERLAAQNAQAWRHEGGDAPSVAYARVID